MNNNTDWDFGLIFPIIIMIISIVLMAIFTLGDYRIVRDVNDNCKDKIIKIESGNDKNE